VNQNTEAIDLHGLYDELILEGIEVVTATAKDLPPLEGYSDTIVNGSSSPSKTGTILFPELRLKKFEIWVIALHVR
jgi:hypothetical protein